MERVVSRTWLATLLFVMSMGAVAAKSLGGVWIPVVGICTLVVTPLLWWWLVERRERAGLRHGAAAGAPREASPV